MTTHPALSALPARDLKALLAKICAPTLTMPVICALRLAHAGVPVR